MPHDDAEETQNNKRTRAGEHEKKERINPVLESTMPLRRMCQTCQKKEPAGFKRRNGKHMPKLIDDYEA